MASQYWQREHNYRRRLLRIIPLAAIALLALFLTSSQVDLEELDRYVGWKGEIQLMPEISIVPDESPVDVNEQERATRTMTALDVEVQKGHELDNPVIASEKPREEPVAEEETFDDIQVRAIEARKNVPFVQDYVLLHMVKPKYPPEELKAGVEGTVTVEILVDDTGRVEKATVISAVGPVSFQDASLEAVHQFLFQPPRKGGKPSPMWVRFVVKFRIFN